MKGILIFFALGMVSGTCSILFFIQLQRWFP